MMDMLGMLVGEPQHQDQLLTTFESAAGGVQRDLPFLDLFASASANPAISRPAAHIYETEAMGNKQGFPSSRRKGSGMLILDPSLLPIPLQVQEHTPAGGGTGVDSGPFVLSVGGGDRGEPTPFLEGKDRASTSSLPKDGIQGEYPVLSQDGIPRPVSPLFEKGAGGDVQARTEPVRPVGPVRTETDIDPDLAEAGLERQGMVGDVSGKAQRGLRITLEQENPPASPVEKEGGPVEPIPIRKDERPVPSVPLAKDEIPHAVSSQFQREARGDFAGGLEPDPGREGAGGDVQARTEPVRPVGPVRTETGTTLDRPPTEVESGGAREETQSSKVPLPEGAATEGKDPLLTETHGGGHPMFRNQPPEPPPNDRDSKEQPLRPKGESHPIAARLEGPIPEKMDALSGASGEDEGQWWTGDGENSFHKEGGEGLWATERIGSSGSSDHPARPANGPMEVSGMAASPAEEGFFDHRGSDGQAPSPTTLGERGHHAGPDLLRNTVLPQLLGRAAMFLRDGQNQMQISLKPEFLGRVRMEIVTEKERVTLRVETDNQPVKALIEANANELKAELRQHGLIMDRLEVLVSGNGCEKREAPEERIMRKGRSAQHKRPLDAVSPPGGFPVLWSGNLWSAGDSRVDCFA